MASSICNGGDGGGYRRWARTRLLRGSSCGKDLVVFAATILLSFCATSTARSAPKLADYCPQEPATGQLKFKSVDSADAACTPSERDVVGQAVFQCWQQFVIEVNGCQVTMRTAADQVVGPGRLPCRMFGVSGNLTGDGVEAQMWADVDGPGLLSYYYMQPEAVAALRYDNSRQLVRDIWAFMRSFTGDLRFNNASWIDEGFKAAAEEEAEADDDSGAGASANQPDRSSSALDERPQWRRRQQMAAATEGPDGATEGRGRLVESQASRRSRHGPMRVYRTSATRVVVKAPTSCKYRYTVNPDSEVFDSPARHRTHVEWRTVLLTAASLSAVLTLVGLGACTYFSRRHAEYVASYWEYQAVKDQLGSQLPPSTYVRLFGEQPKAAAAEAAAAATAAALVAAAARNAGAAAPAAPPPAESRTLLSPAAQRHTAAEPRAQAGEPPGVGAGEPDGIGSRSSSANDSGVAAGRAAAK